MFVIRIEFYFGLKTVLAKKKKGKTNFQNKTHKIGHSLRSSSNQRRKETADQRCP